MHHMGGPNSHIDCQFLSWAEDRKGNIGCTGKHRQTTIFLNIHLCNLKHIRNPLQTNSNAVEMAVRLITCATNEDDADLA